MRNLLFVLVLTFLSCESDPPLELVYLRTQCSEPWYDEFQNNDIESIKQWFDNNGYVYQELTISQAADIGIAVCQACNCPGDEIIQVITSGEDSDRFLDYGFTVK